MAKRYKYGMRLRGYSIACQPMDDLVRVDDTEPGSEYYNVLIYARRLSVREESMYELDYLGEEYDRPEN